MKMCRVILDLSKWSALPYRNEIPGGWVGPRVGIDNMVIIYLMVCSVW
jgi:hypothetical protein